VPPRHALLLLGGLGLQIGGEVGVSVSGSMSMFTSMTLDGDDDAGVFCLSIWREMQ
jgi:hypothetical protein